MGYTVALFPLNSAAASFSTDIATLYAMKYVVVTIGLRHNIHITVGFMGLRLDVFHGLNDSNTSPVVHSPKYAQVAEKIPGDHVEYYARLSKHVQLLQT